MQSIFRIIAGLICTPVCGSPPEAGAQEASKSFSDAHVRFSYPGSRYAQVRFGEETEKGFYTYYLKLMNSDAEDTLTVCNSALSHCGMDTGSVKPYWYNDDGALVLFSATTVVKEKITMVPNEVTYEAYPACPAADNEGVSNYGGDCYELLKGDHEKTLSITYWIGPGILHLSKAKAAKQATNIPKSVVVKKSRN